MECTQSAKNSLQLIPINYSAELLEEFGKYLAETGRRQITINIYQRTLIRFFEYCTTQGSPQAAAWLHWDATPQIKRITGYALRIFGQFLEEFHPEQRGGLFVPKRLPHKSRPNPQPLDNVDTVVRNLIRTAKRVLPFKSYQSFRVYLHVLRELGVRKSEGAGIQWNDINWTEGSVLIHGKGGYTRQLPLSHRLVRMFAILRNRSVISPWIGAKGQILNARCLDHLLKKVATKSDLSDLHCHSFRTTKLTEIGNSPSFNELLYLQYSGHHDLTSALWYCKPDVNNLRNLGQANSQRPSFNNIQ